MTESQFIEQNKEKWKELEFLLELPQKDADKLQDLFVKVSSDLSYARTFYPKRSVRLYLNNLTQKVFDSMGKKKSGFSLKNITNFFSSILPEEAFRQRRSLLISFLIFTVSMTVGALSTANNPEFAKIILGESYVRMTEENINKEDPMAVYKDEDAVGMFAGITVNNIRVAFVAFVLGILGGIGTVYILVYNGIMVGVFQYYFYSKGLFLTSFLTIWIHGTIEILAIIIAGAAGLVLGKGLLFPGTFKRSTSMQISAKRSLRILLGTIPLFIIAGLLESFVTRLTDLPTFVKVLIIAISLLFVLTMYVIYPYFYNKKISNLEEQTKITVQYEEEFSYTRFEFRTFAENLSLAFAQFRAFFGHNFSKIVMPCMIIAAIILYFASANLEVENVNIYGYNNRIFQPNSLLFTLLNAVFFSFSICYMELFMNNKGKHVNGIMVFLKQHFIYIITIIVLYSIAYSFLGRWAALLFFVIPFQVITALVDYKVEKQELGTNKLSHNVRLSYRYYFHFFLPAIIAVVFIYVVRQLFQSWFGYVFSQILEWHNLFDDFYASNYFSNSLFGVILTLLLFPLIYFLYSNSYYSFKCKTEAIDLRLGLPRFGKTQNIFEE